MGTFWGPDFAALEREDPEIAEVVLGELRRQRGGLQLIASENFTSPAVLAALGSTLTNKYAEGYPGARFYGGCAQVDLRGWGRMAALFTECGFDAIDLVNVGPFLLPPIPRVGVLLRRAD